MIDFKKGNYAGANQAFDRAVPYIDTTWNSARSPGILLLLKSRAAMLQGRYREAAALTHQYASLPEISGDPDVQFEAARALTQAYKAMGMTDSAYHYMARSVEMADSLLAPSSYGSLRDMQADRDLSRAAEQYRLLELQGRWVRIALWFSLGVVAVVSLLLWLIVRQKRQLKVRNRELFDRYQEALEQERRGAERLDELTRLMERKPAADSIAAEAAEAEMPTGECGQEQLLIADRVRKTLDTSERIYEKDFTMDTLAEMMEVPKRFISQAINAVFHKNFPTLLGEARVREACRRLGDPENFGHLTIEGIADSIGFRSRTNFVSVFKK